MNSRNTNRFLMTLGLFPLFAEDNWVLEARVRRFDGKETSYSLRTGVAQKAGWFMLPVWLFSSDPPGLYHESENLFRHLLRNLRLDGFLERP